MNKKVNTVLFLLGATLVNVVLMITFLLGFFILFVKLLPQNTPPVLSLVVFLVILGGSFFLTYKVYNVIIVYISKKFDMEKYLDPLIRPRKR